MTLQLGSHIVHGELSNASRNSVCGWLDFGDEMGIHIQLTGNFAGDLAGQQVRFQPSQPAANEECSRVELKALAKSQIGIVAEMSLRSQGDERPRLYLEWFSQNGHIIAEILDPILELGPDESESESLDEESALPGFDETSDQLDFLNSSDASALNTSADEETSNPAELFSEQLDHAWRDSSGNEGASEFAATDEPEPFRTGPPREWDEIIPGLDPETKRLYDEWDAITDGTKDEPITSLFDPPLTLKRPDDIADEAEAAAALQTLLARLALHCVAVHICQHFTALDTYRWLVEDLLPEEGIHPNLGPTGFVMHYDTSEDCPKCDEEFEARYKQRGEK